LRIRVIEYTGLGGQEVVDENGKSIKFDDLVGKKIKNVTKDKLVVFLDVE
jgi:hypothetical protein